MYHILINSFITKAHLCKLDQFFTEVGFGGQRVWLINLIHKKPYRRYIFSSRRHRR